MITVSVSFQADFGLDARWQEQWRDAISDPVELLTILGLESEIPRVTDSPFKLRVPKAFVAKMRRGDPNDPLLRQVLPIIDENRVVPGFDALDPVGDASARTAQGVLQKYQGRALLITTGSCAIHCRYCFRRHYPYSDDHAATSAWHDTVEALRADESVEEVILSGGDPLSMSTRKLRELTDQLATIGHIKRLRIHTRLPNVLPARIDDELADWIATLPFNVAVVIHANHANEFDADVDQAIAQLRNAGAMVLNQAVLLRGINDDVATLKAVSERTFAAGALPYYLHVLDRVQGAAHFDVSDDEARALHRELAKQLSGYLVPKLVREIEGETGKTPL